MFKVFLELHFDAESCRKYIPNAYQTKMPQMYSVQPRLVNHDMTWDEQKVIFRIRAWLKRSWWNLTTKLIHASLQNILL